MTALRHHEPLPLETRRVLWRKIWEQLLTPLPTASNRNESSPADLGLDRDWSNSRAGEP